MVYVNGNIVFLLLKDKKQDCLNTQQLIHPGSCICTVKSLITT